VTQDMVSGLEKVERARDLAEERLRAAATRVEHHLEPGAVVHLGGEALVGDGSVLLTQRAELRVKSVAQFTLIPGGEDLDALRRKVDEEARQLTRTLAEIGADSVASAQALLRRRQELDGQVAQHAAALGALAPQGLQGLEDRLSSIAAQQDSLRQKLGDHADRAFGVDGLARELEALESQSMAGEKDVSDEEKVVQQLREGLAGLRAEKVSAERLAGSRASALQQARSEVADETLETALSETTQAVDASSRKLEAAQQTLEAENPAAVEVELERSNRALTEIKEAIDTLDRDVRDLKVELVALGQRGLAEEVASVEADHALAAAQLENVGRRARAHRFAAAHPG
jgi:predicted  nucleic acid-binding Zn-ribbon protein